mmetsp:Transcript_35388/g.77447  ORF Transcript_35388/g.77447 Transcript_35388/m.77447 type:complete len:348 (+) Transcript_35388:137-1180(+)|eukprot:CAMPEP_0170601644 /NCGR_PEP_ID=MMETSP0224-20130122/17970_1 /TAXON_ID=285029 /ORGANISM="Togula jolla, Strain CCCM 725" /LENGTH=347 /DNA_ID=CAMNT_0010926435 /DNA_START=75 /DNA_END=1118 /DNA_ORIENTATION=+
MEDILRRIFVALLPLLLGAPCASASRSNPVKFLIVSSPRSAKLSYMRIHQGGLNGQGPVEDLITAGMVDPQGIAVDQKRKRLFVADPDSRRIFAYPLTVSGTALAAGNPKIVADNIEARWVACDSSGNLFYSDEVTNKIMRIPIGENSAAWKPKEDIFSFAQVHEGVAAEIVYDGASLSQVSAPGGIAIDTFQTYWVNKQIGTQVGSLIAGMEQPSSGPQVVSLTSNTDKSYGVCLALNNVFYTQPEKSIYGVKTNGENVALINNQLMNPRGCAWDGDGTVYVADRGANGVYSFAANMKELGGSEATRVADFEDAFGVAVFSNARRYAATSLIGVLAVIGSIGCLQL